MTPDRKCAILGAGNPPLKSSTGVSQERIPIDPATYERDHQPIAWPAYLDENSGILNETWAEEMRRQKFLFWRPLGARMIYRWISYNGSELIRKIQTGIDQQGGHPGAS